MNTESEDVLKALSSSTRRTIMRQISDKGSATYTEIMHVLGLDPSLMSGKFNYHLKALNETGLIERTNGEYKITDLGKRALILVDQVAKDVRIDQYGVLSVVMSMSPRKELVLFMSQLGMMAGFLFTVLSFISLILHYDSGSLWFWLSGLALTFSLLLAIRSTVTMIGILRNFKLGLSVLVFLSSNWFFIRSPNRNYFFAITMLVVAAIVPGALSILLPSVGEMLFFSLEWIGLVISAVTSACLVVFFSVRAKRKADRLEALYNEQ